MPNNKKRPRLPGGDLELAILASLWERGAAATARELHEEAALVADEWHVLLDHYSSPGGSTEALRVFLARGLTEVPDHERHERQWQ